MSEHASAHLGLLPLDERVKKMQELEAQERDFEQSQRMRREHREIEGQRQELEDHLRERGTRYVDATGAQPTEATLAAWRDEWADNREREHQAEQQRRHEAARRDDVF